MWTKKLVSAPGLSNFVFPVFFNPAFRIFYAFRVLVILCPGF